MKTLRERLEERAAERRAEKRAFRKAMEEAGRRRLDLESVDTQKWVAARAKSLTRQILAKGGK